MHSPFISILGHVKRALRAPVSSTGFAAPQDSVGVKTPWFKVARHRDTAEVLYVPTGCGSARESAVVARSALSVRERTESNKFSGRMRGNSNRKERQIAALPPLLNWANTSGIRLFADPQRQSSAWTDELVMDRGAEGAARGYDAV